MNDVLESERSRSRRTALVDWAMALAFICITVIVYAPGLSGGYFFDDYPNIVDNPAIRIEHVDVPSLVRSALSSPSSEFRRPIASLSFSMNYLIGGTDPFGMKVTNLIIHLINGVLVFVLVKRLLNALGTKPRRISAMAALISGSWMLLPINLTAVLYIVQRMESLANLFVLLGLCGYVGARTRLLQRESSSDIFTAVLSLVLPTLVGVLAKETASLLSLYAFIIECSVFRWKSAKYGGEAGRVDTRLATAFVILLALPLVTGLIWLLPGLLKPQAWASREFTLSTRLLSEARIVWDYIVWTLVPTPSSLSFYHDDFAVSSGWFSPWTTAASTLALAALIGLATFLRKRVPGFTLGIFLFFGAQTLASTILPLELVYEHRNYFASLGLLIALAGLLNVRAPAGRLTEAWSCIRVILIGTALIWWTTVTANTAYAWGSPLRLAQELAVRGPDSPRAQYELGRAYIIASRYDPSSPYAAKVYAPLKRAVTLPAASVLPEQALIFFNSRMGRAVDDAWWTSMATKLRSRRVTVQDESSLIALAQCKRGGSCRFPNPPLDSAFRAALSHSSPTPRLLAAYGDFAWGELRDRTLALTMFRRAVDLSPDEPAYRLSLARLLLADGKIPEAREQRARLAALNVGGALDSDLARLDQAIGE